MNSTVRYLLFYTIFLALAAAALFAWNTNAAPNHTHPLSWGIYGFFAIAYLASHFFIMGSDGKKPAVFVRRFMAATTIRLMTFLGILVTYAFLNRELAVPFISHFLVFYFAFTVFEVASLYSHFRKN